MKPDIAVFIGRFQPFHNGHLYALKKGLEIAERVIVIVGDTGGPRGLKNPFTVGERYEMILQSLTAEEFEKVTLASVTDAPSDTTWAARVQAEVTANLDWQDEKVVLIGHDKDESSFYLKMFPQWKFIDTGFEEYDKGMLLRYDATRLRQFIYTDALHYAKGILPEGVMRFLMAHERAHQQLYKDFRDEYRFLQKYREAWAGSPFPPVFVTTDCVVVQSGHILLVQRKENPGKGLWALPGGFIDQRETIEDCAIRELLEETNIKLQPDVLRRCIKDVSVVDRAGGVSEEDRGRIITHVHLIKLEDNKPLPKVKAGDDAADARWTPIGEINYRKIFSDHGQIIQATLGKV